MLDHYSLLNKIIASMDEPVAVFDRNYRFIWYNDAYRRETERVSETKLHNNISFELVFNNHPLGKDTVKSFWDRALGGESFSHDYEYLNRETREQTYLRINYKPLLDARNNVIAACTFINNITPWKSGMTELKKQEEQLLETGRLARIGSWEINFTTLQLDWSETIYQLLEYDKRNTLNINKALDFYEVPGRQQMRKAINNCLERGEHFDLTLSLTTARGKRIWARTMGKPDIRRGRIERVYGTFQDVTDQYLYEEKIKESEQRLKSIIDNAPAFIYIKDLSGKYTMVNKQYESRFGKPEEMIVGNRLEDLMAREVAEQLDELDLEVIESEKLSVKKEFITFDNRQSVFITTRFPVYNIDNKLTGVCGISTDVTEVITLRSQLSKNNELLSMLFDTVDLSYASLDESLRYTFVNMAGLKEIGVPTVIGEHVFDVQPSLRNTEFEKGINDVLQSRQSKVVEYFMLENQQWYESSINNTEDGGVHIFTRNITTGKHAENTVKQVNDQLTVLNEKLTRQNKQLEEFAQITSHNLRAPVANLVALIEMFEHAESAEERDASMQMLKEATHTTYNVLNELTEVLKIQRQQAGKSVELKLETVLDSIIKEIHDDLEQTKTVIEYDFSAVQLVEYPRLYLENIFRELIINAIKFRKDEQSPHIRIASQHATNGIILTFTDNGTGIDLGKYASKMFKMHKTFHRKRQGKGLGLFIIKSQLESVGGEIEVNSRINEGTTFKVKL